MRLGVLADVHANAPALRACLEALDGRRLDRLLCLGDLVGYNAEPAACVALCAERADTLVRGNHDHAVGTRELQPGTGGSARDVIEWTRAQLDAPTRRYLASLPRVRAESELGVILAHGCFLNEDFFRGYVTSTMLAANLRVVAERSDWPSVALCGHTHVPTVAWLRDGEVVEASPTERVAWPADADAVLINPGAVGQPRDGDPRAACAVLDLEERTVDVMRIPYDVEAAVAAIARAGLRDSLGARLREGR